MRTFFTLRALRQEPDGSLTQLSDVTHDATGMPDFFCRSFLDRSATPASQLDFDGFTVWKLAPDPDKAATHVAHREKHVPEIQDANELYADGGVISKNPSVIGGTWCYCAVLASTPRQGEMIGYMSGVITPQDIALPEVTNNVTELWAIVSGLEAMPQGWSGTAYSDSQNALGRVFSGWKMRGVPLDLQRRTRDCLKRLGRVKPVLLMGHPSPRDLARGQSMAGHSVSVHNQFCDEECTRQSVAYKDLLAGKRPVSIFVEPSPDICSTDKGDHQWDGPWLNDYGSGESSTCSKCGMLFAEFALFCLP